LLSTNAEGTTLETGAGYGFKISAADRDRVFSPDWAAIQVNLPSAAGGMRALVNVDKDSFWGPNCRELIGQVIGQWLIGTGHAPWPRAKPPKFEVRHAGGATFNVVRPLSDDGS
jgi:hypothetical protein